ncbi:MAG TPA: ribosomal protein S18-alanine N-acetyltransferase [Candidatus Blautia pullicola]|uniref:[Ribosomal protein bS18]-alanine N-acetyltransferase n=1 Tax=Candidatus Blautia pullicola TaxID=2838498 RepID=A0A9D2JTS7_9FIRM|nr:ribosomal protein S18-alanine N-acetyltransferase [Candidatus Blautia pullicola]
MEKLEITIRKMREEDCRAVAEIEKANFTKPWSREAFLDATEKENAVYFTALWKEEPVGYIGMWKVLDEGEITNVSVKKIFQGKGIGRRLVERLLAEGSVQGVTSFFLEVRQSNESAIRLYTSCGFEAQGIRRNFYEAPREDAVLMCKR